MYFEIISEIEKIEPVAVGKSIRDIKRLRRQYGRGRWRKLKGIATVRLIDGRIKKAEIHWYKAHGIGNMKRSRKREIKFAVCITDSEPDLEMLKLYRVLPDEAAEKENHLRVIDESGEDYLYPASFFVMVNITKEAQQALLLAS